MGIQIYLISGILMLSTVISISLAVYLFGKRSILIARYLFYLQISITIWTFSAIFEAIASTVELKLLWTQISFFGMGSLPVLYFLFAIAYAQWNRFLSKQFISFLFLVPLTCLIIIWTNSIHHLYYTKIMIDPITNIATYYHGTAFWLYTVYAYFILSLGLVAFLKSLFQQKSIFKPQIVLLLSGAIVPFVGNILYLFHKTPLPGLEWTPILFTFSGLLITWGIYKYRLLDIAPSARHRLIELMPNGIIVVDKNQYVVDINPEMESILGIPSGQILGRSIESLQGQLGGLYPYLVKKKSSKEEFILTKGGKNLYYQMLVTPLVDIKKEYMGTLVLLTDITDRKYLSDQLKDTETLYTSIADSAQDGIITINDSGIIISVNNSACNIFGYKQSELVGHSITMLMPADIIPRHEKAFNNYIKTGTRSVNWKSLESEGIRKDKRLINLEISFSRFQMKEGHFFTGFIKDITDKKQAEAERNELYVLNNSIINSSPLGFLTIGTDGKVTSANPAFLKMMNSPGLDQTLELDINIQSLKDAGLKKNFQDALTQNKPFYERRLKYTSYWGENLVINIGGVPLSNEGSKNMGILVIIENVTKTAKIEENYNLLAEAVTKNPARVTITDQEGIIQFVNPAFEKITGFTADETIGETPSMLKSGAHPDEFYDEMWDTLRAGKVWISRLQNKKKNGELFWEESIISSLKNEKDEITHFVQIARDITAEKEAEDNLKASREMLRALSDATFESIFISDKGRCLGQNKTAERMFGYTTDEAIGKMGTDWIVEEDRDTVMDNIMSGYEKPYEVTALRKDGSTFPCEIQGRMIDFHGRNVRVTALRDITRRKAAFGKIIEQQNSLRKMSIELVNAHDMERRNLARELHDEFGQTLTATLLNIDQLTEIIKKLNITEASAILSDSTDMIETMNTQLRELTLRLHPMMLDELGLVSTMNWYIARFTERSKIKVITDIPERKDRYPEKIESTLFRIFQESLHNAEKYSATTSIDVSLFEEGPNIILMIQDHGIGFDPNEIKSHPKDRQRMGIRGMKERITYLGGSFTITSVPGQGTEVKAIIPLVQKQ
ncbi:MAG: PAS domain S-box protein [Fidelibacterota bacterium]